MYECKYVCVIYPQKGKIQEASQKQKEKSVTYMFKSEYFQAVNDF